MKQITLMWTDPVAREDYGVPSLQIDSEGIETGEEIAKILKYAHRAVESSCVRFPKISLNIAYEPDAEKNSEDQQS